MGRVLFDRGGEMQDISHQLREEFDSCMARKKTLRGPIHPLGFGGSLPVGETICRNGQNEQQRDLVFGQRRTLGTCRKKDGKASGTPALDRVTDSKYRGRKV